MTEGKKEYLEDITGSDHLEPLWGERFKSWYRTMSFNRAEQISLPDNLNYQLKVFDHQYRWIMPAKLDFYKGLGEDGKINYGIVSYSEAERLFGVFRFPVDSDGYFSAPVSIQKISDSIINLTPEEIKELIQRKKVLTFEAFKIPLFGFQYFSITDYDFTEIEKLAGTDFTRSIRGTYEVEISSRVESVKDKIMAQPNYLSILQNVLDLRWKNEGEISTMTGGILHFGI